MVASVFWIATGAFVAAFVLTFWMRRIALAQGIIDHPNARSSHLLPTARGGGLAIVIASALGVLALTSSGIVDKHLVLALLGGGLPIAAVGFRDDRGSLTVRVRFVMHAVAAIWGIFILGGLPPLQVGARVIDLGFAGDVLGTLAIMWTLNLVNFMDGIDGIAASEAVFVAWSGMLLGLLAGAAGAVPAVGIVFGAACCGFLLWNWPPAKIFMGDVGSGYIGYVIAVLAVAAARESPVALFGWLILGGVFFVDATVTLLRRLVRRERVYVAHRSHAYQWLARRWGSHMHVTLTVMVVNLVWLLPCALLTTYYPEAAGWIAVVALAPVSIAAIVAGAGREETNSSQ